MMPTTKEMLELEFQANLRLFTHTCWSCDGIGFKPEGEKICHQIQDDQIIVTYPKLPCDRCDGTGKIGPDFGMAVATMMGFIVRTAVNARNHEQFATMNEVLDWGIDLLNKSIHHYLATEPPEKSLKVMQQIVDAHEAVYEAKQTSTIKLDGALTPKELQELGLDDE